MQEGLSRALWAKDKGIEMVSVVIKGNDALAKQYVIQAVKGAEPTVVTPEKVPALIQSLYKKAVPITKELGKVDTQIEANREKGLDTTELEQKSSDLYRDLFKINEQISKIRTKMPSVPEDRVFLKKETIADKAKYT